ncbi:MAG: transporter substrate-binding domain-containing protein [Pyrinomonadaceae bacterium]|nr:transporter substrate-binding domain-containing protein [Pyrinomonadaceae bacterium]
MKVRLIIVAVLIALSLSGGCSKQPPSNLNAGQPANASVADDATADSVMPPDEQNKPWKGDFDAMAERRVIRALVVYSRFYFVDGAEQHGSTYEGLKEFENVINKQLGTNALKVHVAFIPVTRDQLLPALIEGRGDIAAANLSITGKRLESVDFSDPLLTGVRELVVTGPSAEPIASLDDLAGKEVQSENQAATTRA